MISQWRNPLPLGGYTTSRVVVYFHSGSWIPIMFCRLDEALILCRKAAQTGEQLFVFPADTNPQDFDASPLTLVLEVEDAKQAVEAPQAAAEKEHTEKEKVTLQPAQEFRQHQLEAKLRARLHAKPLTF